MRYTITEKELPDIFGTIRVVYILEIIGKNIFFAWDDAPEYDAFKEAINTKGMDVFVDLILQDNNTAFLLFCQP